MSHFETYYIIYSWEMRKFQFPRDLEGALSMLMASRLALSDQPPPQPREHRDDSASRMKDRL
jgi:hypothetical protein